MLTHMYTCKHAHRNVYCTLVSQHRLRLARCSQSISSGDGFVLLSNSCVRECAKAAAEDGTVLLGTVQSPGYVNTCHLIHLVQLPSGPVCVGVQSWWSDC